MQLSVRVLHFAVLTVPLAADFMKYVLKLFVRVSSSMSSCREVGLLQSYAELVRVFLEYVDIDLFIGTSAPGRIAVEGRWPWRDEDVYAGLAAARLRGCAECCWPRVSGGTPGLHMHGATCFSGASVDKVSFEFLLARWTSPRRARHNPGVVPGSHTPRNHGERLDDRGALCRTGHHPQRTG